MFGSNESWKQTSCTLSLRFEGFCPSSVSAWEHVVQKIRSWQGCVISTVTRDALELHIQQNFIKAALKLRFNEGDMLQFFCCRVAADARFSIRLIIFGCQHISDPFQTSKASYATPFQKLDGGGYCKIWTNIIGRSTGQDGKKRSDADSQNGRQRYLSRGCCLSIHRTTQFGFSGAHCGGLFSRWGRRGRRVCSQL